MWPEHVEAIEGNRMLFLEMRNQDGDLAAAEERNRFIIKHADKLWTPHITTGGMLDRLLKERKTQEHQGGDSMVNWKDSG